MVARIRVQVMGTVAGNFTTLPQHFKDNGYLTQSAGKIFHPGPASGNTFDYPYSWSNPAYYAPSTDDMYGKACPDAEGNLHVIAVCPVYNMTLVPHGTLPDIQVADFAVEWLRNKKLYPISTIPLAKDNVFPQWLPAVAWNPWHNLRQREDVAALNISWPYGPVPEDFQLKMKQSYSAAASYTDSQLGRVLQALDEGGFANTTIISFHGDHGWSLGEHEEWCKFSNFDIARRIPLMFYVPGVTSPPSSSGHTFPFIDPLTLIPSTRSRTSNTLPQPVSAPCQDDSSGVRQPATVAGGAGEVGGGGLSTNAFAEAVDIYPTLCELAGLDVPPTCSADSLHEAFCTEGSSLVPVIKNATKPISLSSTSGKPKHALQWKDAIFSQYPRPSYFPQKNSDNPHLADVRIMGYTLQTDTHRYTEWVAYDPVSFTANWSQVYARELYMHQSDPLEDWNMADVEPYTDLVTQLSKRLRIGWRYPDIKNRNEDKKT
nr:hypothetical protein BaRGS_022663 [Batillaria attramentaria]